MSFVTIIPHTRQTRWRARLVVHPNWTFHFTPTSSSWLNAVEGFLAKQTKHRLKRAIFNPVAECEVATVAS